jgi:hypothetical protein
MMAPMQKRLCIIVASTVGALIAVIGVAILVLCKGHLIYTFDDPYISLALSQHIAHGHYGINANEVSSPSSSILFPLLLAGFARFPWQEWVPAILNSLAACATAALIGVEICRLGILRNSDHVVRIAVLTVALCIACNVVGLVYIGLEHSFHVLTCVVVVSGLARVSEGERVPLWLVIAIVLLPLWRFEGLAFAGLAILSLTLLKRWRAALIVALGIGVTLGAYATAMITLGLPVLPSSVLLKSDVAREAYSGTLRFSTLMGIMFRRAVAGAQLPEAWPVIILIGLLAAHPLLRAFRDPLLLGPYRMTLRREALFAAVLVGALVTHVLLGSWGWFGRYESYAVATGALGAIIIWHPALAALASRGSSALIAAAVAILFCVGNEYVIDTLRTPVASLGIFEQQYQMHRFAVDFYKRSVGVNDLGWVSYRNPNYVLDLAGLESESTRMALMNKQANSDWMEPLVVAQHVGVVMIYDSWFVGQIPARWRRIAVLKSAHLVTASSDVVSFYATSGDSISDALEALRAFSHVTAAGTKLTIL